MGITHSWNGTVLTITSDSGTSSADLKGDIGIRGPQGATGNQYKPQYGVDYFTEAELAAIKETVTAEVNTHVDAELEAASRELTDYVDAEVEAVKGSSAPAGYGLGSAELIPADAIDSAKAPGFYCISSTMTVNNVNANYWYMIVAGYGSGANQCVQKLYPVSTYKLELTRFLQSGVWGEWECNNPPMLSGVEYRTTERYNGKPVNVKCIDFGALPNNSTKTVTFGTNAAPIQVYGRTNNSRCIPHGDYIKVRASYNSIEITTTQDYSSETAILVVKYI